MIKSRKVRKRQRLGSLVGVTLGCFFVAMLLFPGHEQWHVRGPMNVGHEDLSCQSCHLPAPGTVRQQLQANAKYLIGTRSAPADFGTQDVGNQACLACHQRPNDRHPVFRFVEPRFAQARQEIQPQHCISCHLEHTGKRVTIEKPTYCMSCHQETKLVNDPITISHETLIKSNRWTTCLGCHDYHGNHIMTTETIVANAHQLKEILGYFEGSPSPYAEATYYEAKGPARGPAKERSADE